MVMLNSQNQYIYYSLFAACAYNKLCIPEGNTYYDDEECTTRTCTLTRKGKGKKKIVTMQMKITDNGKY